MTVDCMTCAEIEEEICSLLRELADIKSCGGLKVSGGGTEFDYTPALNAKEIALEGWQKMFDRKCKGSGDLYEFIHVPCVRPATCVGTRCNVPSRMRQNRRRYRG